MQDQPAQSLTMTSDEVERLVEQWGDGDPISRRRMLAVMGASLALLGLNGCFYKKPEGKLVPYPKEPEEIVAGRPVYFASAMPFDGYGQGVLALSREGRPIKIEGNPDHPDSRGASDVFMQASLLDLYDPDRSRHVTCAGQVEQWWQFQEALRARLDGRKDHTGVRLLTGTVTSPTLAAQIEEFTKKTYPGSRWHVHDPIRRADEVSASSAFAESVNVVYDLTQADAIVSLDADFLYKGPGHLRYARQFIDGRRVRQDRPEMNRLYVAESTLTITGSMADHRLGVRPSRIPAVARALAQKVGAPAPGPAPSSPSLDDAERRWVEWAAADLAHPHGGRATLVIAGESQSLAVHALAHAINQKLGNDGRTVHVTEPVDAQGAASFKELVADMQAGRVDTLLILGGNPAYTSPADLPFADALEEMSARIGPDGNYAHFTAHLASHDDETTFRCQWHVPRAHWLEAWGDVRAFDGTASIIQPLIAPIHGGRSEWEVMEAALGRPDRTGLEVIRDHWVKHAPGGAANFEQWWMAALQKGVIDGTAAKGRDAPALRDGIFAEPPQVTGTEVLFQPDPNVWTGEFANNAWLQELPKPFTKLTWDNAVIVGLAMARKLAVEDGRLVRVKYCGRQIDAPVVILPGQPDGMITLHLGYGRTKGGRVLIDDEEGGKARGFNAYALRTSDAPWHAGGVEIKVLESATFLAMTRGHHAMSIDQGVPGVEPSLKPEAIATPASSDQDLELKNRRLVRVATLEQFKSDRHVIEKLDPHHKKPLLSLYPGWDYGHGLQWGMTIDMTACIGCNACVIACQAENNIPVVGKREVGRQREMHWIRIDDYFDGSAEHDNPAVYHQPVPCMHCETAPCEYVCPVGATTHSDEGLNEMTYNRCVGTRYCSNNCPYKVRRFNFLLYSDYETPELKLMHNPDVTVRSRGVMEKCTYCVQRIDRTRIEMEREVLDLNERALKAGSDAERGRLKDEADRRGREIIRTLQTACQQSCPTEAITFGDIRDPDAEVTKLKQEPTNYGLLTELSTKPRTTYLARITNPNHHAPAPAAGGQA